MKPYKSIFLYFIVCFCLNLHLMPKAKAQSINTSPLRLAVAGITHGHVSWILGRKNKEDVIVAGIYEPNTELAQRYAKRFNLNADLFYTDLRKMLDAVKPEAVVAFGSIYQHMAVVEACAPRGIHVMVEKPLATNVAHAERMAQLARKYNIHLLTNYETSWYPTTEKTYQLVADTNYMGRIKKVVVHDGHQGPKEIGVNKEFLDWLTDPVQNGGGALIDFGCYGANLMTYLMQGQEPVSVTAVTRQFKPAIYPKVDDDATIIVAYPAAQCIIQASWNWPFSRKDMEVYGETGYVVAVNNTTLRMRNKENNAEQTIQVTAKEVNVYEDPFSYFADVIRGRIQVPVNGLYSLENNVQVVRILEAARQSAKTGKTVPLQKQIQGKGHTD
ncbi:MAG: Gfo/Idh/MocA family oxidoreductase [Bacteroidota bacterium]|nr:Gfo/Idh/MocA family oxidoreductase [Bacteroidota bacterium]